MPTIFTKIIRGELPSYKVFEDEHVIAFLDIFPVKLGHTLVVPKVEVDYFVDVPEPYYSAVFRSAQKIAPAIQKATGCRRVGTAVIGLEVPHFHYHLIPLAKIDDLNFAHKEAPSPEALAAMQKKIIGYL